MELCMWILSGWMWRLVLFDRLSETLAGCVSPLSSLKSSFEKESLSEAQNGAISQVSPIAAPQDVCHSLSLTLPPFPFTLSLLSSPSCDHPVFPLSHSLQAFFEGKLKMRGNIMLSQKLDSLLKDHAKLWGPQCRWRQLYDVTSTVRPAVPRFPFRRSQPF